ncbi:MULTISPECIES: signal recognition particle-docking protein FtsY [unclassified Adlercreutzia]|uniref:signal recognition particle-docking protein FtsY n=1 Tax=unclassified Adlercreutzia TaxID=2636013 RepID=UPI001F1540CB|nr:MULTISPECIES: signal recognition particle-docking protein FtsY [unclassified Adlercreutzia]
MGFFDKISEGLSRSRDKFKESMNVLLDRGPNLDEDFWETLEETLILSDIGGSAAFDIVERLRDQATRLALPDAYAVLDLLNDQISATFTPGGEEILGGGPALLLFVGINGTGKTTTVGKIAKEQTDAGRSVILGSADTFRAAAIEQLEVWARRAGVEMVTRERGSDPASVCYDTIERAEAAGSDLVLIDTAGRLHTSADLMRELEKVVNVVRKRSELPVYTVLVIDATTGQNGLQQAREFNRALDLDALIVTKLDGTAKGGIALAVSHELELPIIKIGVGEGIDDLRDFDAHAFSSALIGDFDERYEEDAEPVGENAKQAAMTAGERRRDVLEGAPATAAAEKPAEVEEAEEPVEAEEPAESAPEAEAEVAEELAEGVEPEAAEAAAEFEPEPAEAVASAEPESDDAAFTDEELAELALAAADPDADSVAAEPAPVEQPRKKHFWEKWF